MFTLLKVSNGEANAEFFDKNVLFKKLYSRLIGVSYIIKQLEMELNIVGIEIIQDSQFTLINKDNEKYPVNLINFTSRNGEVTFDESIEHDLKINKAILRQSYQPYVDELIQNIKRSHTGTSLTMEHLQGLTFTFSSLYEETKPLDLDINLDYVFGQLV